MRQLFGTTFLLKNNEAIQATVHSNDVTRHNPTCRIYAAVKNGTRTIMVYVQILEMWVRKHGIFSLKNGQKSCPARREPEKCVRVVCKTRENVLSSRLNLEFIC